MPKPRTIAAALVVVGLGSAAIAGGVLYATVIAPAHQLPRDRAAIEADWAQVQPWLPEAEPPQPSDPTLYGLVKPLQDPDEATVEDADRLALWLADGGTVPEPGCAMMVPDAPPQLPPVFQMFRAGQTLVAHDHPEAALELAAQLREGLLIQLMISEALVQEVHPEHAGPADDLFVTLTTEIACSEAALEHLSPDDLGELPDGIVFDLETERWKLRDWWARLLLALHPVRDDRDAMRAVVEGFEPPAEDALLARMLATGTLHAASDYLQVPEAP